MRKVKGRGLTDRELLIALRELREDLDVAEPGEWRELYRMFGELIDIVHEKLMQSRDGPSPAPPSPQDANLSP